MFAYRYNFIHIIYNTKMPLAILYSAILLTVAVKKVILINIMKDNAHIQTTQRWKQVKKQR